MRAHTQRLFHDGVALRALLAGEMGWDSQDLDSMHPAIVGKPVQEYPPASIMNAFCQSAVTDHVADLKVLIGNQVVRRDQRVCLFAGKIFTLPLHFQMLLCQSFPCSLSIGRFLVFTRKPSLETLELLFSCAIVSRIVNGVALRVSQEALETDINTQMCARWNM